MIDISVVIPLLNEELALPELLDLLRTELEATGRSYEIIAIDDGSEDHSLDVLKQARAQDNRLKIISFRRNFGKSDALHAGFRQAQGQVVFTMDADLQDDPREIPRFLEKLEEGWDLISGWKKVRHDPASKTLPSRLFNAVTSKASGIRLHDFNCGFKCYRREAVDAMDVYGELHRFLPAIAHMKGFRVTEIPVTHHARPYGSSKFGAKRFLSGVLDLMTVVFTTRYLRKPLHFFGAPGLIAGVAGALINFWLSVQKVFFGQALSNRPLLFLGILLMIVGLQLVSIGLIGEMITRGQKEPDYQIREALTDSRN